MIVKIKRYNEKAVIPFKKHDSDFCYDVVAVSEEEVAPNVWKYGLGFGLQADRMTFKNDIVRICFNFRSRSSVWKTGMAMANSIGTIDEGYTGEIFLVFYHVMPNMPRYHVGDKIAQCMLEHTENLEFKLVDSLDQTDRGDGGFGSTNEKKTFTPSLGDIVVLDNGKSKIIQVYNKTASKGKHYALFSNLCEGSLSGSGYGSMGAKTEFSDEYMREPTQEESQKIHDWLYELDLTHIILKEDQWFWYVVFDNDEFAFETLTTRWNDSSRDRVNFAYSYDSKDKAMRKRDELNERLYGREQ